ncbi:MAG TPA: hypothetical protein VLX68_01205 [Chitinivibrionales bacterium]|nr:hypothetical protein [Chitinivibrionales bacterium]
MDNEKDKPIKDSTTDKDEGEFISRVRNKNRFNDNWQFYRALTAIALGIFRKDLDCCCKGLKGMFYYFRNELEEISTRHGYDITRDAPTALQSFLNLQGKFQEKILCIYRIDSKKNKNQYPDGFLGFPAEWKFKEDNFKYIADLLKDKHSPYQLKVLKRDGILKIAHHKRLIGEAFLRAFPKIREISLDVPEIVASSGISPIDEIFSGMIKKNTWFNLEVLCRKWNMENNSRDGEPRIREWDEVALVECIPRAIGEQVQHQKFKTHDDTYLRFHLKNSGKTIDVTYRDLPQCSNPKKTIPTTRWYKVLAAFCGKELNTGQRSDVNEAFTRKFGIDSAIIDRKGKLIFRVDSSKINQSFWDSPKGYRKHSRNLYSHCVTKINSSNKKESDKDFIKQEFENYSNWENDDNHTQKNISQKFHEDSTE